MKTNNCCCCFSVWTGAHIIGILMVLGVVGEISHPGYNILRWVVKIAAAATYIFMLYKDNATSRFIYFLGWIGSIAGMIAVNFLTSDSDSDNPEMDRVLSRVSFDDIATKTCEGMKAEDREAAHFDSM